MNPRVLFAGALACAGLASAEVVLAQAPVQGRSAQGQGQSVELRLRRVEQSARAALSLLKQIDALRREVQTLRNANERLTNRLEQAENRLERLSKRRPAASAPATTPASNDGAGDEDAVDTAAQSQYEGAVDQLMAAKYPAAIKSFTTFLQEHGSSRFAGKAQYFLAESHYQQGDVKSALAAYQQLLARFPNDSKVPESSLKIADLLDELGRTNDAITTLRGVVTNYPGTTFESLARQRLAELGG
ncbi:MAG: tol-pal system protein YbgF [Pseudomonadota bacterium]